ncbi:hypothetical protein GGR57DRAFT_506830 [Xylariaceae sp. FL1272]|nr:hypothetical protein GGR57DRAFT_506830 [Xylariaceae sp. FL1272]
MGALPHADHDRALKNGFHRRSEPGSEPKSKRHSTPGSNELSLSTTSPNPNYNSSMVLDRLFARQNGCGGSVNGGCDLIPFCSECVTVTETPCIQATLSAITGPLSGTDISVFVNQDGAEVCSVSLHCNIWDFDCSGLADVDCGDGYDLSFNWNNVIYYSLKYDRSFPMYLERVKENDFQFCTQNLGLLDLPSGCLGDEYAIESGPCRNNKKRDDPLSETMQTRSEFPDHRLDIIRQDAAPHLDNFTSPAEANPASIFRRAYGHFNSPTSCAPRAQKLTNWIADTIALTQAAIDAIKDLEANPTVPYPPKIDAIASTLNNLLGVDYGNPNRALCATIRQNFEAIQAFANGVFSGGRPWIFCGDAWTEPKQWSDWALKSQGQARSPQPQPYWAKDIGDFVFYSPRGLHPGKAGVTVSAICSNGSKNPVAVTLHSSLGFPIITICSPMNKNGRDGFTVFPYDSSGTMLHEFMHAVKGAGRAPDVANNAQQCSQASLSTIPSGAMNSPECNTLFAMGMWVQRQTAGTTSPLQFKLLRALPL